MKLRNEATPHLITDRHRRRLRVHRGVSLILWKLMPAFDRDATPRAQSQNSDMNNDVTVNFMTVVKIVNSAGFMSHAAALIFSIAI